MKKLFDPKPDNATSGGTTPNSIDINTTNKAGTNSGKRLKIHMTTVTQTAHNN
jgi:hypothetical protein